MDRTAGFTFIKSARTGDAGRVGARLRGSKAGAAFRVSPLAPGGPAELHKKRRQRETKIGGRADNWVRESPLVARVRVVQVVLRKLGRGSRAVSGRLVRAPRKGSVVVIEFPDGMHEYVTTPVKRVLRMAARNIFYIKTVNSRYRLEIRDRERTLDDASTG
jgi:hypothetical protein